jgi:hypothetical protein
MSKTPKYDAKIKEVLDALKPGERTCQMTGETWDMDEEEISWYKKFNVPPSVFSPKARMYHMSAFYTVYQWWWNKHFDTGKPVLSYVHPASEIQVLPDKEWFDRDFSGTNLEYNTDKPLLDLLRDLQLSIPVNATRNTVEPENSIATISIGDQNSFFVSGSKSKDSMYLVNCEDAEECVDCTDSVKITESYHCLVSNRLHRCKYIRDSHDLINCSFMFDCRNCEFCFGASNKRNKKYLFWDEQLTKDEWEKRVSEIDLGDRQVLNQMVARFDKMINDAVWPENFNVGSEDSVGEYLINCSNNKFCSLGRDGHNNYYSYGIWRAEDNAFSTVIPGDHCFQASPVANTANSKFCTSLFRCDDLEYSINCYDCTHCFGCVGLQKKTYCIFNKQYSEDEYWSKVDDLKCSMLERGEYGRPIPTSFAFAYFPESGPYVYMGAEEGEWDMVGLPKFEAGANDAFGEMRYEGKEVKSRDEVPEHINDLDPEKWVGVAIDDPDTKRPFAYLKQEIEFYKKHNIAPPLVHFSTRVRDLVRSLNNGIFEQVKCVNCDVDLTVSTNSVYKQRKIHCKKCYLKYLEVHG